MIVKRWLLIIGINDNEFTIWACSRPEYAEDKPSGAGAIMSMNADMDGYFMK